MENSLWRMLTEFARIAEQAGDHEGACQIERRALKTAYVAGAFDKFLPRDWICPITGGYLRRGEAEA